MEKIHIMDTATQHIAFLCGKTMVKSWCDKDELFEWDKETSEEPGCDIIVWSANKKELKVTYWK